MSRPVFRRASARLRAPCREERHAQLGRRVPGRARQAYGAALEIRQKLAAADPQNAEWQWDLVVSLWRLAGLGERRDGPATALGHWQEAARIARDLAGTGRLAPADAWMPADLDRRLAAARERTGRGGGRD